MPDIATIASRVEDDLRRLVAEKVVEALTEVKESFPLAYQDEDTSQWVIQISNDNFETIFSNAQKDADGVYHTDVIEAIQPLREEAEFWETEYQDLLAEKEECDDRVDSLERELDDVKGTVQELIDAITECNGNM